MKKVYLLLSLLILLSLVINASPLETHVNGTITDLKSIQINHFDLYSGLTSKYYIETEGDLIPYKKSFEIFGKKFISSDELIRAGGRFEVNGRIAEVMYTQNRHFIDTDVQYLAKTSDMDFLIYDNGEFKKFFSKGVNIGAAKPGYFPGELAISKDEYLRWFEQIKDMGANTIRVYTTLMPEFYEALYEFNLLKSDPLYLIHGVWVNEEDTITILDAYGENNKILNEFIKDSKDIVDIIHGRAVLPKRIGFASGTYKYDVSSYMIGWILGTEWDPYFVEGTNKNYQPQYYGDFLYTVKASPFEIFLARVGDEVIAYEYEKYKTYRPLAFSNWLTTDPLKHPNEPMEVEDMSEVDTENIKGRKVFKAGLFASYHVYPYYPEFINSDFRYREFIDDDNEPNTYKAYLKDLIAHHTKPVIVAEFGVPSSRGKAHDAFPSGYNQGKHTEKEQGYIIVDMFKDIFDAGYFGGIVFSWQDEWFKKTWNTMDFDDSEARAYWSNPQTNEQHFGLLSFDPGEEKSICYVDGNKEDWNLDEPFLSVDGIDLFVKSDEKHVFFAINGLDLDEKRLVIPIDTINGQGSKLYENYSFEIEADFIIDINGRNASRILVNDYYDTYQFQYGDKPKKESGQFNKMYLSLNRALYFPQEMKHTEPQKYETGIFIHGNANPNSLDYNSLSDFYHKEDFVEIKIPWQLLNVMNPAKKYIMDDIYKHEDFVHIKTDGFMFGLNDSEFKFYSWDEWDLPTYHERLKESYFILKDFFKDFAQ